MTLPRVAAASVSAERKINFSTVFAGQAVGIKEVHDDIWLVSFMDFDSRLYRFRGEDSATLRQPFWPKGVSYVFGTFCKGCLRTVHEKIGGADGIRTHDLLDAIEARSQLRHGPTGQRLQSC